MGRLYFHIVSLGLLLLFGCHQAPEQAAQAVSPTPVVAEVTPALEQRELLTPAVPEVRPVRLKAARNSPPKLVVTPKSRAETNPPVSKPSPQKIRPPTLALERSYPKAKNSASSTQGSEAASLALDKAIQSGQVEAAFQGTGDPRKMVHLVLFNSSSRPIRIRLEPGMILDPGERPVQPLLVTEEADFTLQPGDLYRGSLTSFCMDSRVPAPRPGETVAYRFSDRTRDGGPAAVRAHNAAEKLAQKSPYKHAITQIAIWKALKQPVEEKHWYSVLGAQSKDPRIRQEVLRQVERVLRSL